MSKMREALEKFIAPLSEIKQVMSAEEWFSAGYQAAIADVKAGGAVAWKNPNPQHPEDWHSTFERRGWLTLYKLPEDE